jgi:hypothetical protein
MELFIGKSHVKCKLNCFKHLVGEPTENGLLPYQIQPSLPPPQMNITVETQSMAALATSNVTKQESFFHIVKPFMQYEDEKLDAHPIFAVQDARKLMQQHY